jgi:NADH-quinone oxidoreductase subunit H
LQYIQYIQDHKTFPLPDQGWEMHQPPLFYLISAIALSLFGLNAFDANAILVLRLIQLVAVILIIAFVGKCLRLLFPNQPRQQAVGIILAGYGSGSKWSLFGGIREAAQVVSYEVPRAMSVLLPVILAGSLNLNTIARLQSGFVSNWFIFHDPFTFAAFWIFFICATASCKRAPFDLAEAESELVAGFHTEYSGLRWSLFFMAEYGSMFAVSGIAAILFLGGWNTGLTPRDLSEIFQDWFGTVGWWLGNLINVCVFIGKGWFLVFVMMWVRWTLPRLRIDQVMMTCLRYLLPISCVLLMGVSVWQLLIPPMVQPFVQYALTAACIGFAVLTMVRVLTQNPTTGIPPSMLQTFGPANAPR